jgi:hypothetical protein
VKPIAMLKTRDSIDERFFEVSACPELINQLKLEPEENVASRTGNFDVRKLFAI